MTYKELFNLKPIEQFVIPNGACKATDRGVFFNPEESFTAFASNFVELKDMSFSDDIFVQAWTLDKEEGDNSNFSDHGVSKEISAIIGQPVRWPGRWPVSVIGDKKEGTSIVLTSVHTGQSFRVVLNQRDYRYRNFGHYEDAVKHTLELRETDLAMRAAREAKRAAEAA